MKIIFLAKNMSHFRFYGLVCQKLSEQGLHEGKVLSLNGYYDGGSNSLPTAVEIKRGVNYCNLAKKTEQITSSLTKYIVADRELKHFNKVFFSNKNCTKSVWGLTEKVVSQIDQLILNEKPHFFVSEFVTGLYDGTLLEQCLKRKIGFVNVRQSKMSSGIVFCKDNKDLPSITYQSDINTSPTEDSNVLKRAETEVEKIREEYTTPSYMVKTKNNLKPSFEKIGMLIERFYFSLKFGSFYELKCSISWYLHKTCNYLMALRISRIKALSEYNRKFFIFPLHYEPEQSVDIRGYPYSQLELVEIVAKHLPVNTHLLVKEHQGNLGYRSSTDYKRIISLPNVSLVSSSIDSKELVQKSIGVLTISGRMGWEACVLHRPVFVFGDCFYKGLDGIGKFTSLRSLSDFLSKPQDFIANSLSVKSLAVKYEACVYPGNFVLNSDNFLSEENVKSFVENFLEYVTTK